MAFSLRRNRRKPDFCFYDEEREIWRAVYASAVMALAKNETASDIVLYASKMADDAVEVYRERCDMKVGD